MNESPVAIIGMHRSGTSLLARKLEECGLFLGWRQQPEHAEAFFFQGLNDWIFRQAGGTWDAPAPLSLLDADPRLRPLVIDYLRLSVSSPRTLPFLGPARYARHRSLLRLAEPWGWKDPRTTLTVPIWAEVFPGLRLIHVVRHGVDVASSLTVRYGKMVSIADERYRKLRWTYRFRPRASTFAENPRVSDLDHAFHLWELYSRAGSEQVAAFGDRAVELRYEDLLRDPVPHLRQLAAFSGLDPAQAEAVAAGFDSDRGEAFRRSSELSAYAERMSDRLATHGY